VNRTDSILVLLRQPDTNERGRALDQIADELVAMAWELEGIDANASPGRYAGGLAEIARNLERDGGRLRRMWHVPSREFHANLEALDALCAHCGHDAGDHLVEAPHGCEHALDGEEAVSSLEDACGCSGFVPPGAFRPRGDTLHDADTEPPPASATSPASELVDEHEAVL
jgi:hypothetical protein